MKFLLNEQENQFVKRPVDILTYYKITPSPGTLNQYHMIHHG